MARPKALPDDLVRIESAIPWYEDAALNAAVAATGISKASILRLIISTGIRTYVDVTTELLPTMTPHRPDAKP